jgi:hypothetical protein
MSKPIIRKCIQCGTEQLTASKSPICLKCNKVNKPLLVTNKNFIELEQMGYVDISCKGLNKSGHYVYSVINPNCNHIVEMAMGNFRMLFNKTGILSCSICGSKRRAHILNTSKENQEKRNKTIKEKYNVEHVFQIPNVKQQIKQKFNNNYITNILPIRLKILKEEYNIIADGWNIEDYKCGKDKEFLDFIHISCGHKFKGIISNGSLPYCPKCSKNGSLIEQKLKSALLDKFEHIKYNDRTLIAPKEIDIVINNKLGIEVNGVYWHREEGGKVPLLDKTNMSPIQLIHLWDYELYNKFDLCVSMICAKLGKFEKIIYARKTKLKKISIKEAKPFFDDNHIQGHINSSFYLGLYFENELVMALSIGKSRFNKNADIELHRLATKKHTTVIGGVDKLFKHIGLVFKQQKLISYADKRYSNGDVYKRLGFTELKSTTPNYFWVNREIVLSRYQCQKHKLEKLLGTNNYNPNLSEADNMLNNGYFKIKDCGNKVFIINL